MSDTADPREDRPRDARLIPPDLDADDDAPLDREADEDRIDSAEADRRAAQEGAIGDERM